MDTFPEPPAQEPVLPDSTPLDPELPGIDGLGGMEASRGSGYAVTVHTHGTDLPGGPATLAIEIRSTAGINEPLTLCIDQDYLDRLGTLTMTPAPEAESSDGMYRMLDFPAPRAPGFRLSISAASLGTEAPAAVGDLNVYVGGIHVATIDLRTGEAP